MILIFRITELYYILSPYLTPIKLKIFLPGSPSAKRKHKYFKRGGKGQEETGCDGRASYWDS